MVLVPAVLQVVLQVLVVLVAQAARRHLVLQVTVAQAARAQLAATVERVVSAVTVEQQATAVTRALVAVAARALVWLPMVTVALVVLQVQAALAATAVPETC